MNAKPYQFLLSLLLVLCTATPLQAGESARRAEALAFNCFTCHGPNGQSPGSIKSLNSLSSDELRDKLMAFKRDEKEATIMNRIAKGYSDSEIGLIADYIASLD